LWQDGGICLKKMKNKRESFGTEMISWQAPEFVQHARGPLWVMVMSALAIGLIFYGIVADSIAFSLVVVLFAGVFFLTHKHQPKIVQMAITDLGVVVGEKFYPFSQIRKFWIIFDPPEVKTLNLRLGQGAVRDVAIQLDDQNPSEIRALLANEIQEWTDRTETLTEILIRVLKL